MTFCSAAPQQALSQTHTTILLNFLNSKGYRASQQKAQLTQTSVTYLDLKITLTTKALTTDRLSLLRDLCPLPLESKSCPFWG